MSYIVCKYKDDGSLFVNSRKSREIMLNVLLDIGGEIESVVLKEFETFDEAMAYKTDIEKSNEIINGATNGESFFE